MSDNSCRYEAKLTGAGLMRPFLFKIFSKTLILLLFISLTHCTGVGSPGGAPGSGSGGLGPLDGNSSLGVGGAQPGAPINQPTEDSVPRLRPQKLLIRVLPPQNVDDGTRAEISQGDIRAFYLSPDVHPGTPPSDDTDSTNDEGFPGNRFEAGEVPQEAQQVPGPFVDSQPYVWFQEVGKPEIQPVFHPTNDFGLVNLDLYYRIPKEKDCTKEFRFYACDEISERVWLARPVSTICPLGDFSDPYIVELQLMLPVLEDSSRPLECPPTLAHSAQEAPTHQQIDP